MKTSIASLACALAVCLQAGAQPSATERLEHSPRHQEWVQVKHGDRSVSTFVVYPEVETTALAVLVIHENRGLTDWVRAVADRLAENGYIALAPDLLSGTAPNGGGTSDYPTSDAARQGIYRLDAKAVVEDLQAVADYAINLPANNGHLAIIGFCWGGSQTWRITLARPAGLVLACPFYGTAPDDASVFSAIPCEVQGFYGGKDERVDATIEGTRAAMASAGKTYVPVVYEGARHAYMRAGEDESPDPANKAAMEQSWQRLLKLLADKAATQ